MYTKSFFNSITSSNKMRYTTDEQLYDNCDYVIEMLDSSWWIIHSNSDCFIENLWAIIFH